MATRLRIFTCPATSNPERLDLLPEGDWDGIAAVGDYSTITQVDLLLFHAGYVDAYGQGIMPKNSKPPRLADVTDGLSSTILVTESAGKPELYRGRLAIVGTADPTRQRWRVGTAGN